LRERAEGLLEKSPRQVSLTPGDEVQNLVHELRVYQNELEMQNDELRRVQLELETSRDRFANLYDLAPVGYLTLQAGGVIREANQTAARLLGLNRQELLREKFTRFIAAESQDEFYRHRQQVSSTAGRQTCELQMRRSDRTTFTGRLESIVETTPKGASAHCLVALSDVTRHRQAEAAVRASQKQLAGIIRSAMDAIITVNSQQRILLCNEAAERMFGRLPGQLTGRSLDELIPKAARWARVQPIRGFNATGVAHRQLSALDQVSGLRADGTAFPIEASVAQVEQGGEKLFTLILRDITERVRLEADKSRLAAIVDSSEDAILSRDLDDIITTWNAGAEKLFGYSAAEIVGCSFGLLIPPNHRDEVRRIRRRIGRGEVVASYDTVRVAKDGRRISVSSTSSPIRDTNGKVIGISAILRDVTTQKEAEEALLRSEAELSDFFSESPLGLLWVGADGRILRVNRAQLEMLGCAGEEILRRPITEFHADPEAATDALDRLTRKEVLSNHCARLRHKDGSIRHVLIDANGLWVRGRMIHSRWFVRDITYRVELEREILRISELEQQRLGQELHDDVCQQLTGIEFLAQGLEKDLSAKSLPSARSATEIARLLREANLRVRELSHGLVPAGLETEGLVDALEALALRTRRLFRCDCRVDFGKPVAIDDPEVRLHLYRIAQEAVGNALKHGRAKRIDLRLFMNGKHVVLGIHDNGVGLAKTPRRSKGLGIRLMQYRARLISGSLHVQREASGGTSVVCSVPRPNGCPKERAKK
jgi:PAS domain S-box-containing protein